MYTIHIIPFATPAYDETVRLRDEILRQPLGISFTTKDLEGEYDHYHLACYDQWDRLLGCMVLIPLKDNTLKMRQVAVDKAHQKKGIGKLMVAACEEFAQKQGFAKIVLNARDTAVPFYDRLGYEKIGKPFIEVTIPHYKMQKEVK